MDVVGLCGFAGRSLSWIDEDRFLFSTGTGVAVFDISCGPRGFIWRTDVGVGCVTASPSAKLIALAHDKKSSHIEIVSSAGYETVVTLANPSSGKILDMCFSVDGNRLLMLSDSSDHQLVMYDVIHHSQLFCVPLDINYEHCAINPIADDMFVLSGRAGVTIGRIQEYLKEFLVDFEPIYLPSGVVYAENDRFSQPSLGTAVAFSLWAPGNHIFVGTTDGIVYELDIGKNHVRVITSTLASAEEAEEFDGYPKVAALTSTHLIIGTTEGVLNWYPSTNFNNIDWLSEDISSKCGVVVVNSSYHFPIQSMKLRRGDDLTKPVNNIAVDPMFLNALVGSSCGAIYKISLGVTVAIRTEQDEDIGTQSAVFSATGSQTFDNGPQKIELYTEPVFNLHDGVSLCSTSFMTPIIHAQENTFADLLVLGSHRGQVSFWRSCFTDEVVSTPRETKIGPMPKIPKLLSRSSTADKSAVTSLELLSVGGTNGARMLAVGTASGWLEVWLVESFADETEDEEEQIPVVVATRVLSRRKLFCSAVAVIKNSAWENLLCVAGAKEDFVYVFDISNSATFQRIDCAELHGECPSSVVWTKELLWIGCKSGKLLEFNAQERLSDQDPCEWVDTVSLPQVCTAIGVPSGNETALLVTMFQKESAILLSRLPTAADRNQIVNGRGPLAQTGKFTSFPSMTSVALCSAISQDCSHYATGCADGSINVYTIMKSDDGELSVGHVQTHTPHGAAVISVCFTVDSAQLVSCAADSSIFYTSVGLDVTPKETLQTLISIDDLNRIKTVEDQIEYNFENNSVVKDILINDVHNALVKKYSRRTESIESDVGSIRDRVQTLIEKNNAANELEKMELSEFVVDVEGRDRIISDNKKRVSEIYEHYSNIKATNELVAARIRKLCWDPMEKHVRRLFPLQQSSYNLKALESISEGNPFAPSQFQYVASFPTKSLSDKEQTALSRVMQNRVVEVRCQRLRAFERDGSSGTSELLRGGSWRSTWEPNTFKWCPATVDWLLNDGERWPTDQIIDEILRREKERLEDDGSGKAKDPEGGPAAFSTEDDYEDNSDRMIDENSIFNMLLPPTSVRTVIQKRNQIVLLNEFCRIIKLKFNGAFDKLCNEKDDCLASIEARYVRIREIFAELKHEEELPAFSLHDIELSGTDIKLSKGDVKIVPYESAAIKAQKAKEAEEKRKRDAERDKADVKGRALNDMMNGVLEVKKDLFASSSEIEKPSWFVDGLTVDKMNDSQRKEFEEYEARVAAAEEEQNKVRKLLEMEVKKLRSEIVDLCKVFDDKLLQLSKLRMLTQRELLAQEMYISNLALSMVKREKLSETLRETEKLIEIERGNRTVILGRMDRISNRIDEYRSDLTVVQEEERAMDRTFRRDIQSACNVDFDQETLRVLQNLYRIRHYPKKTPELDEDGQPIAAPVDDIKRVSRHDHSRTHGQSQSRRSFGGGASHQAGTSRHTGVSRSHAASKGSPDGEHHMGMLQEAALALDKPEEPATHVNVRHPFYKDMLKQDKTKQEQESHFPLLSPLYMDRDCPDGFNIDQYVWIKLQELRHARIEREIEAKRIAHEIHLLKVKLDHVSQADLSTVAKIDALKNTYAISKEELASLDSNLNVVVALRQGQDEVDRDAVATEYSQSRLIPAAVPHRYNTCINELGKEKIGVLTNRKQFRRKMNLISWEAVHLGMDAKHLEELYTDCQMLKVTRNLQRVIREGSDPEQVKARLDRIGTRKHYLANAFEKKLDKETSRNSELRRTLDDRVEENEKLKRQIETLAKDVAVRGDVRQARGIDHAAYEKKMKKLMSRRHLVDTVRSQAEQIDLLKDELDRLRQKTYPSFVRATRTRLAANPDELGNF